MIFQRTKTQARKEYQDKKFSILVPCLSTQDLKSDWAHKGRGEGC